jgi:catechol 2,3-dioxygenase-like lactoylglutathione lyase family enzyme
MKIKESNVTINVKDLGKSISFYESIGLTLKGRWGNFYAQVLAPGITIGLHPAKDSSNLNSGTMSVGFTVDNFDEVKTMLMEKNIQAAERSEEGGQFMHFTDPDGTALYFIKPKW